MKNIKYIVNITVFCLVIAILASAFLIMPDKGISVSERRKLMSFSDVVSGGDVFNDIEEYFLDQFPLRDSFRTLKAIVYNDIFMKNDNNKIYKQDGTVVKIEDTLDESQVKYASEHINKVIEKYAKKNNVYFSIVPDKHYYASKENGYPALDYDKMLRIVKDTVSGAEYIDIFPYLSLSNYYTTDSHWSQEKITDVAETLVSAMSPEISITPENGWKENTLTPFYGVYYGQSALSLPPDDIKYLTSDATDNMKMTVVKDNGTKETLPVYVLDYFKNIDPYDVFAGGAQPIVIIENPLAKSDKNLVVFRDSFGSSIAPLLAQGYAKVTLVDLRYMVPDFVGSFVSYENSDVLFLYSTGLLNSGRILKDFLKTK